MRLNIENIKSEIRVILLLVPITIIFSFPAYAQTIFCPPNIGFEDGNLNHWEFFVGGCCPINVTPSGVIFNRHTLTSGSNLDPYGRFPIVADAAGSFSLKLGNDMSGSQAERARYYIHVPSSSGKHILLYRYAVVLENPGHSAMDQPRFAVSAFDSATNALLPCSQIEYVSSDSLPGFIQSKTVGAQAVFYKPWTTATIDLSAHAGRTVAIEFSSTDCGQGGHFGYGYVDMNCGLYQIEGTICDSAVNQITLNGPQGYKSYEWRDASLTNVLGSSQTLVIPTPSSSTTFAVLLTPYVGFGCPDTLYTTFNTPKYSKVTMNAYGDTTLCIGAQTSIRGIASGDNGPFTYNWTPTNGLSCTICHSPTVTGTVNTIYRVTASDLLGCADTGFVTVAVDSFIKTKLVSSIDTACSSDPVLVVNTLQTNPANKTQTWFVSGGTIISGGGQNDTAWVKYNTPGPKTVSLSVALGDCKTADTVNMFIGSEFSLTVPPGSAICPGDSIVLNITNNAVFPLIYSWVPSGTLSCNNCPNPTAKPTLSTNYIVYADDTMGCRDTGYINIAVDTVTYADMLTSLDTICVNEILAVKNIGDNPDIIGYLWAVDSANILYGMGTDSISLYWTTPGEKFIRHKVFRGICETSDTQSVFVIEIPQAGFEIPQYACLNEPVPMLPLSGPPLYTWYIQDQNIQDVTYKEQYNLLWNTLGVKTIKLVVNDHHCTDSFSRTITVNPFPLAKITVDKNTPICVGKELKLSTNRTDRYNYSWQPARVFNTNNQSEVIATVERTERYYLEVTNQWGCTSYDSIYVKADGCCDIPMPDAFTPNGDGHNDTYKPVDLSRKQLIHFMIANRRGQIVFNTTDATQSWDGNINGQQAGQDTYNYYIKYICADSEEIIKKGTILLLR